MCACVLVSMLVSFSHLRNTYVHAFLPRRDTMTRSLWIWQLGNLPSVLWHCWLGVGRASFFRSSSVSQRTRQLCSCLQLSPIFTDLKKIFTDRLSNKPFLIWLLTIPPHLNCVAALPCNLPLISCFLTLMFHVVVWQHVQGVVGFFLCRHFALLCFAYSFNLYSI